MRRFVFACALASCAVAAASSAVAASLNDVEPRVRKDAECMFAVLKKEPGIDQVNLGVKNSAGWVHPYLDYRAVADKDGYRQLVRFEAWRGTGRTKDYFFISVLSGLTPVGKKPNDWGTSALDRKWRAQCSVDVTTLYE